MSEIRTFSWLAGFVSLVLIAALWTAWPSPTSAFDDGDDEEKKEEEQKGPEDLIDSVQKVEERMGKVEELLATLKTGRTTQDEQQWIIDELDKVIEALLEMASSSGGGGQQQQQQQQQSSDDPQKGQKQPKGGEQEKERPAQERRLPVQPPDGGGRAPNVRREERRKPPPPRGTPIQKVLGTDALRWGNLPARQRQAVLDQESEEIPKQFQSDVHEYYKRLAGAKEE